MVWIESHTELGDHPKLFVFMRELGVEDAQAVGMLHYLWWWAAKYAPRGIFAKFTAIQIARGARWKGDPDVFIEALVTAGFLARRKGVLALHDWLDYRINFDRLIDKRDRTRELGRQRVDKFRRGNAPVTLSNADVTQSCNADPKIAPTDVKDFKDVTSLTTTAVVRTYVIPEPKVSPEDAIIMRYKILKGVPYDHVGWDQKWQEYHRPYAKQLMHDCITYAKAYACLEHWSGLFQGRGYKDWTLRAVASRAIEWMGAEGGKVHGTANSERFFEALRQQRSVGEGDPGLGKADPAKIVNGIRNMPHAEDKARGSQREPRNGDEGHLAEVSGKPLERAADRSQVHR